MARSRSLFTTVKSEGGLLPPDFLQRLLEGGKGVDGTSPESYHLTAGEKPNEAASRSWNRLQVVWAAFQTASGSLKPEDAGTGLTREKWLLPLFNELGYGRLQAAKTFEIEGKPYPISHLWQATPIHLVGRNVELDRRSAGVVGAAKTTPHGLMQEFLNRHEGHLWGFVSNGLKLRILRDNKSLTRQAYVEFDLAGMMDGQVYSDFALLWLLCHESRVEAEKAEQCWLEKWAEAARQQGTRALDQLRDGVQGAIEALGKGFLAHPANKELLDALRQGKLDKQDYYRQLLRVVYRLIFLFVAEDRDLLLTAPHGAKEKRRYLDHYSASRLRTLAEHRRGTPHPDLWRGLKLVFAKLSDTGCQELGLPALGSFLWSGKATPDLDTAELANASLLEAVRSLAFTKEGRIRRAIDYRNLGAEELGSVYESLLELHADDINADAATFALKVAAGHERKTTGSYYTPSSLIECLLDSALDPVLQEALKQPDPEKALLDLKVCDPACGSGHFLIAAAHRMANRLASVRTGDEEPSPEAVRKALRDIVGRCLYGVDINPMAVELCKVNLWLEALEPGKPLSFLEHHIQCGNSLLGATPALLKTGIPDEAFEPLEGDDKRVCRILKKQNKTEREGQQTSLLDALHGLPERGTEDLSTKLAALDAIPDETIDGQKRKQEAWSNVVASASLDHAKLVADAWCAAFVWKKKDDPVLQYGITERIFQRLQQSPTSVPAWMRTEIARLATEYQLFHWHLAFPGVFKPAPASEDGPGWQGGFDVVLGNPPWEMPESDERAFFQTLRPDIAHEPSPRMRAALVRSLAGSDAAAFAAWSAHLRRRSAERAFFAGSGTYPHSGQGRLNYYKLFLEAAWRLLDERGRLAMVIPSGLATNAYEQPLWHSILRHDAVCSLFDFENAEALFPAVDARAKFSLVALSRSALGPFRVGCWLHSTSELREAGRTLTLAGTDLAQFSPGSLALPQFRNARDMSLLRAAVNGGARLGSATAWRHTTRLMFSSSDRRFSPVEQPQERGYVPTGLGRLRNPAGDELVPVYEGKMVGQYDHRQADVRMNLSNASRPAQEEALTEDEKADVGRFAAPQQWISAATVRAVRPDSPEVAEWTLAFCDVTSATNERTAIASVLPLAGLTRSMPAIYPDDPAAEGAALLVALMNSFAFDYFTRLYVAANHLTQGILANLPVPDLSPSARSWLLAFVSSRVLELSYTAWDLQPFARALGYEGPPFRWERERRIQLRCELDAAFFHLYGIACDDADYILEAFPIVRRADEERYGRYRTKERILMDLERLGEHVGQPEVKG